MPHSIRPGETLADRYLLVDLLDEGAHASFWRAHDRVLDRSVALHVLAADAPEADGLMAAARRSVSVTDQRVLQVLDADRSERFAYVVNEWGDGRSLDVMVHQDGPLDPPKAAWLVAQAAAAVAAAHQVGVTHGRLVPENVLLDRAGGVRLIGLAVDAALFGLPEGTQHQDVTDLGGLLEFALTGKWAGKSHSITPSAPRAGHRPLSPRQIRAGVPRALDALCADLLAGQHLSGSHDVDTARGIADYLTGLAGHELADALHEAARAQQSPYADTSSQLPRIAPTASTGTTTGAHAGSPSESTAILAGGAAAVAAAVGAHAASTTGDSDAVPLEADPDPAEPSPDQSAVDADPVEPADGAATQAGMPIFHETTDDVSWFSPREEAPPPPPEFEDLPVKPLFAPEPAPGEPARRPRPGAPTPSQEIWLGDHSTGSGSLRAAEDDEDDDVPGRNWLRLAMVIGAGALLLLAMVFAWQLGNGSTPFGINSPSSPTPSPTTSTTPPAHPQALTGLVVSDFDPFGTPPSENPSQVRYATDGDPATGWQTSTYNDNLGTAPPALKSGVGLLVDLGRATTLSSVKLTTQGSTNVSIYVLDQRPTGAPTGTPAGTGTIDGSGSLDVKGSGRWVVVWLTSLPRAGGGYRGEIDELSVLGTRA